MRQGHDTLRPDAPMDIDAARPRSRALTPAALVLLTALWAAIGSPAHAQGGRGRPGGEAEVDVQMAPVAIDGQILFRVRGVSALPGEQRADRIRDRIVALARDPDFQVDALRTVESDLGTAIMAGDQAVTTVVDADARLEGVDRPVLARVVLDRIRQAITEYRRARSPEQLAEAGVYTLVATAVLATAGVLLIWLSRRLDALVERRVQRRIHGLEIQSFELVRAERIRAALGTILRGLRALGLVVLTLVYLHFVLSLYPSTRVIAAHVLDLISDPLRTMSQALVAAIPNLAFLAVLYYVVRVALRLLRLFFDAVARGSVTLSGFEAEWAWPTYKIARLAVVAFAIIVAYPYIPGSESAAFKGVSLFLGVIVSIGSSSAISNIIAGYTMTYRRAFKVGDRVKIGDVLGDVLEMRLQVTHVRTPKNEEVIIPNSLILNGQVVNYSSLAAQRGLILHTAVGIGYEVPWRQVEAMLLMAADRTPGTLHDPHPFILQRSLGDFAVTYELNVYCRDAHHMMRLYTALHRNILDVFNEYGVQIMTPAYVGDPEQPKLVAKPLWHAPPAAGGETAGEPENGD